MTAALPLAAGGAVYVTDPDTGLRRTAANAQELFCGGTGIIKATTSGAEVVGDLNVTGTFNKGGFALLPVGLGPLPWSGTSAPSLWVLCYGQALLRASYPDLWTFVQSEIAGGNTLFTNGNGSTTFTVPDLRGRAIAGKDNMGGVAASRLTSTYFGTSANTLGAAGGAESQTLTTAQMPQHTHTVTDPGHTHSLNPASNSVLTGVGANPFGAGSFGVAQISALSNTTGISIQNTGSGNAHPSVQPTIIANYIIYAGA